MILNIFGKTKPINFIIVFAFLIILYGIVHFFLFDKIYATQELVVQVSLVAVLLCSILVVDFIIKRNKLTGPNSFAILYYALLITVFSETITDYNAIVCSFFLLLASRRLISLRSLKEIKLKIFDATIWILVSSLFYEWALLYLLLVFAAIYIYEPKNIRNWLVPFSSVFTFFMITYCILVLAKSTDFLWNHYQFRVDFHTDYFTSWSNSSKLAIYVLITLIVIIFAFLRLGKSGLGQLITMRLIGFSFVIGLVVNVLSTSSDVFPIMLTFFPATIFITNYVEAIKKSNIKEIILIVSIVVPFLVFISSMAMK
jgi:hypothetical protein